MKIDPPVEDAHGENPLGVAKDVEGAHRLNRRTIEPLDRSRRWIVFDQATSWAFSREQM